MEIREMENRVLLAACSALIIKTIKDVGQKAWDGNDIVDLAEEFAEDLQNDFHKMTFNDVVYSIRIGIRDTDVFSINIRTLYKWVKTHKKLLVEDMFAQQKNSYTPDRRLKYRSKSKSIGLESITKLLTKQK